MYTPPRNSPPLSSVSNPGTPVSTRPRLRESAMRHSTTRQDDTEPRAATRTVFSGHRALHGVAQRLDDPQADAMTARAARGALLGELEQPRQQRGIDPGAFILDHDL